MRVMETELGELINSVLSEGSVEDASINIYCTLMVGAVRVEPQKIHQLTIRRDYANMLSDITTLLITVTKYQYDLLLYPNRLTLEAELTIVGTDGNSVVGEEISSGTSTKYRAKLINPVDTLLLDGLAAGDTTQKRKDGIYDCAIELTPLKLDDLTFSCLNTVLKDNPVQSTIEAFCSGMGKFPINVHPVDCVASTLNTIVPDGTNLLEYANWMQAKGTGVYFNGIGTYVQGGWVYVYPLSLLTPHPHRKVVNIVRVSDTELLGVPSTFCYINDGPYILSSGDMVMMDDVESKEYVTGNATRWNQPNYLSERLTHADGVSTFNRAGSNVYGIEDRVRYNSKVVNLNTRNSCREMSRVNETQGRYITVDWDNAVPGVIFPNMEVILHYPRVNALSTVRGVVSAFVFKAKAIQSGGTVANFKTFGKLTLRVQ